jgi:hypothetical protein
MEAEDKYIVSKTRCIEGAVQDLPTKKTADFKGVISKVS